MLLPHDEHDVCGISALPAAHAPDEFTPILADAYKWSPNVHLHAVLPRELSVSLVVVHDFGITGLKMYFKVTA
jgi:hypothetical protein